MRIDAGTPEQRCTCVRATEAEGGWVKVIRTYSYRDAHGKGN